jgi:competence protein ComEC
LLSIIPVFLGIKCPGNTGTTELAVHVIDVGHGDCIFIQTPDDGVDNGIYEGYRILIDAGKLGRGNDFVIPYLEALGIKEGDVIDYVIATCATEEHIGGLPEIYDAYQVNNTLDPGYNRLGYDDIPDTAQPNTLYGRFYKKAKEEPNSNLYWDLFKSGLIEKNGDYLDWGDELQVRILYVDPDVSKYHINNSSIVLWLKYGNISFLFPGSAEGKDKYDEPYALDYVEKYLVETYEPAELRSTVLKVPNHGSDISSTNSFLQMTFPDYAIICAGLEHGLPEATVIERYMNIGTELLRTDEKDTSGVSAPGDDNIVIVTDGNSIYKKTDVQLMHILIFSAESY